MGYPLKNQNSVQHDISSSYSSQSFLRIIYGLGSLIARDTTL
nr:MAG TPA: hypothetical protein [Caudoviricetes sp.]